MGNNFGLGLVLSFTDRASVGIMRVTNTLSALETRAKRTTGVMYALGTAMNSLVAIGSTLTTMLTLPLAGFLTKIISMGVQRTSDIEKLSISFETLMGSAKEASQYLGKIYDYALTTPYRFNELAQVAQILIARGVDANKVLKQTEDGFEGLIPALADWSGGMAAGMSGVAQMANIFGRIQGMGKVYSRQLIQMEGAGLRASKIIGNMYNMSEQEAREWITSTMDVNQFMNDIIKGIEEGTDGINGKTAAMAGMVEKLKHTWSGAKDYFTSALTNAGRNLMGIYTDEEGVERSKYLYTITEGLNNISDSIKNISMVFAPVVKIVLDFIERGSAGIKKITDSFAQMSDANKEVIGKLLTFFMLLGPGLTLIGRFGQMVLKTIAILKSLTSVMGLVTLAATGVMVAVATDFGGLRKDFMSFVEDVFEAVAGGIMAVNEGAEATKAKLDSLTDDNSFIGKLTKGIMKFVGFIQIVSALYNQVGEDGSLLYTQQQKELAKTLGIWDEYVKPFVAFKNNVIAFFRGFKEGMLEVLESVKKFIEGVEEFVGTTFIGDFIRGLEQFKEFGKTDYFAEMGRSAAKILPVIIALQSALQLLPAVGGVANLFSSRISGLRNSGGSKFFNEMFSGYSTMADAALQEGSMLDVISSYASVYGENGITEELLSDLVRAANTDKKELSNLYDEVRKSYVSTGFDELINSIEKVKPDESDTQMLYNYMFGSEGDSYKAMLGEQADKMIAAFFDEIEEAGKLKAETTKFDFLLELFQHPKEAISAVGTTIKSSIGGGISKVVSLLATPVGQVLAVVAAVVALFTLLYATSSDFRAMINETFGDIFASIKDLVGTVFETLKNLWGVVKPIWELIKTALVGILNVIVPIIGGFIRGLIGQIKIIFQVVNAILEPIVAIGKAIMDALGLTTDMSDGFSALATLGKVIGNILNVCLVAPLAIVADAVIFIYKLIQSIISFITAGAVEMPDWKSGWANPIAAFTNEDSKKKKFATGGIVTQPITNATIGEDGAEAIVPLERNTGWIDKLANDLDERSVENNVSNTSNSPVNINFSAGSIVVQANNSTDEEAERLADKIMEYIAKKIKFNATASYRQENIKAAKQMTALMGY